MTEVDQRIVAMHFDNDQFEKGAKETIKTLEQLRNSLELDDAADSLNYLGEAAEKLKFDKSAEHASKLSKALNVLESAAKKTFSSATWPLSKLASGFESLARDVQRWFGIDIAHTIEQTAMKISKALSFESLFSGYGKFEEETNTVAAMYYAVRDKGKSLEDVYGVLEKLTKYSDETSYSYTQMANALSTFIATGEDIDTAELAIEGIANAAAKAGVGVNKASIAFTNFSQAMSKGKMIRTDWMSIQTLGMDTEEIRKELIEAAKLAKTIDDNGYILKNGKKTKNQVTVQNFPEMLKEGFVNRDAIMNFLKKYGDQTTTFGQDAYEAAQKARTFADVIGAIKDALSTQWMTSFRYIIGDLNEATELFSDIANNITVLLGDAGELRNRILKEWRGYVETENEGEWIKVGIDYREVLIKGLQNLVFAVIDVSKAITDAWDAVFGVIDSKKLGDITQGFYDFTESILSWLNAPAFLDGSSRLQNFQVILMGIFTVIKRVIGVVKKVAKVVGSVLSPVLDDLLYLLGTVAEAIIMFDPNNVDGFVQVVTEGLMIFATQIMLHALEAFEKLKTWFKDKWAKVYDFFLGKGFNFKTGQRTGVLWPLIDQFNAWVDQFKKDIHYDEIVAWLTKAYEDVSKALEPIRTWSGWDDLEKFFFGEQELVAYYEKGVLKSKYTRGKSGLTTSIDNIVTWFTNAKTNLDAAITPLTNWDGWKKLEDFFLGEEELVAYYDKGALKSKYVRKKSGLTNIIESIKTPIDDAYKTLSGWSGWNDLAKWFEDAYATIDAAIRPLIGWDGWTKIEDFFLGEKTIEAYYDKGTLKSRWTRKKSPILEFFDSLQNGEVFGDLDTALKDISAWIEEIKTKVKAIIDVVDSGIKYAFGTGEGSLFREVFPEGSFVGDAVTWVKGIYSKVSVFVGEVYTNVTEFFGAVDTGQVYTDIATSITTVTDWFNGVKEKVTGIINVVKEKINYIFGTGEGSLFSEIFAPGTFASTALEWVKNIWAKVKEVFSSLTTSIATYFTEKGYKLQITISKLEIHVWWTKLKENIVTLIKNIKDRVLNVFGSSEDTPAGEELSNSSWLGIASEWAKSIYEKIKEFITSALSSLTEFLNTNEIVAQIKNWNGWKVIENFFLGEEELVAYYDKGILKSKYVRKKSGLAEMVESMIADMSRIYEEIQDNPIVKAISEFFTQIWESVSGFFFEVDPESGKTDFVTYIESKWESLKTWYNDHKDDPLFTSLRSIFETLSKLVTDFFTQVDESGETPFSKLLTSVSGDIASFINDTEKMLTLDNLLKTINDLWTNLTKPMEGSGSSSDTSLVGGAGETFVDKIRDTIGMVDKGVQSETPSLQQAADSLTNTLTIVDEAFGSSNTLVQTITEKVNSITTTISEWHLEDAANAAWQQIVDFFKKLVEDLKKTLFGTGEVTEGEMEKSAGLFDSIAGFFNSITEPLHSIFESLKEWGTNTWNEVKSRLDIIYNDLIKPFTDLSSNLLKLANKLTAWAAKDPGTAAIVVTFFTTLWETLTTIKAVAKNDGPLGFMDTIPFKFLEISAGLWIISKVIQDLSELIDKGKFWGGLGALALIGLAVAGIYALFLIIKKTIGKATSLPSSNNKLGKVGTVLEDLALKIIDWAGIFVIFKYALPDLIKNMQFLKGIDPMTFISFAASMTILAVTFATIGHALGKFVTVGTETSYMRGVLLAIGTIGAVVVAFALLGATLQEFGAEASFEYIGKCIGALLGEVVGTDFIHALTGIKSALWSAEGIDPSMLEPLVSVFQLMSAIQDAVPDISFWDWFLNGSMGGKLSQFGQNLGYLGEGIRKFNMQIKGIDYTGNKNLFGALEVGDIDQIRQTVEILQLLVDIANAAKADAGFRSLDTFLTNLTNNEFWSKRRGASGKTAKEMFSGFVEYLSGLGEAINEGLQDASLKIDTHWVTDAIVAGLLRDKLRVAAAVQDAMYSASKLSLAGISAPSGLGVDGKTADELGKEAHTTASKATKEMTQGAEDGVVEGANDVLTGMMNNPLLAQYINSLIGGEGDSAGTTALINSFFGGLGSGDYSSELSSITSTLTGMVSGDINGFTFEDGTFQPFYSMLLGNIVPDEEDIATDGSVAGLVNDIVAEIENNIKLIHDVGSKIDAGLASGIVDYGGVPVIAIRNVCYAIIAEARNTFDQHSPSKVFADIGEYNMLGLAASTSDYGANAISAVRTVGDNYILAMKEALSPIAYILDNDINLQPTIRPVVDLEDVKAGAGMINGMFNGGGYGFNARFSGFGRSTVIPEVRQTNNSAQVIAAINDRIDELNSSILGMQIVLDSGALVGHTVGMYDRALGMRASRARRG